MNKKILSIFLCVAMLISCLGTFAYANTIDVEIDLSDLFGPPANDPVTPPADDEEDEPAKEEEKQEEDEKEDEDKDEGKNNKPSRPGNGTSAPVLPDEPEEEEKTEWVNTFADVKESDWFYATVKYVCENSIMNGVEADKFAPSNTLTRAMLVTILYRVEGSPRLNSDSKFSDVSLEDWFGAPVIWASENGIVNGVSETEFAPNNAITREQIATIMYRYAKAKGIDVTEGGMAVREFEDFEKISPWASEAMQWAVNTKLISGKTETTVNPLDNATRAETATVVMRFIEANK